VRARLLLALVVALATTGCFGLTFTVQDTLVRTEVEPGESTTAPVATATHDPETDAVTFDVRDDTTRNGERVEYHEETRDWSVGFISLTLDMWEETDNELAALILTPFGLAVDLMIPVVSFIVNPLRAAFGGDGESIVRTPQVDVERTAWAPLELYDPTTGARAPAVNGTRAGDLALNGFRSTALTAIGPDGQERPLDLPGSVAAVFSEAAAGWDRAPEELRVRVPLATSLEAALRSAPAGAWVQLEAGDYQLESTVYLHDRRLTIAGRGAGVTRVHARGVAFWISGASHDVTLRGLAIELDGSTVSDAVRASGGRTVVAGCAFSGARFEEVAPPPPEPPAPGEAPKPPAGPSYRGGVSLHLDGDGYTEVRASSFVGAGTIGVLVTDSHRLRVSGSSFDGSKLEGVSFRGASRDNAVSSCTLRGPGHGVGVFRTSSVSVQSSNIQVTRAGILVDNEAQLLASQNTLHGCSSGISVQGKSTAQVTGNTCEGNSAGILIETDGTQAYVADNSCTSNSNNGITLQGRSSVAVQRNTCRQNGGGILITGAVTGEVNRNTLERNGNGLSIQDAATPSVFDNKIASNTKVGVLVTDTAAPLVRHNDIRDNGAGIGVQGTGARPTIQDNDIASNRGPGIQVAAGLEPAVYSNRISGNAGSGLYREGAPLVAPNNTFTNNGDQRGY
jgi:parallel beta-helix repeat protein